MADRLARLEGVTARNLGRTLQPGFRISRVFSPLRQQLVATPIISPAKPATSNTRSRVRTQAGAAAVCTRTGCLLDSEKTVLA